MPRIALVFCFLFIISSPVLAQTTNKYYGIALGNSGYEEIGYSAYMTTLTGRLGYELDYSKFIFGAEARLGYGQKAVFNDVYIQMDWLISALGKASLQAMDRVYLTAYGGYTMADTKATTVIGSSKITDNTLSYGFSIDLYASREHGLSLEWMRFLDGAMRGADYTVEYFGLGYFSRF